MRKRKYCTIVKSTDSSAAGHVLMRQYQSMSSAECLRNLLTCMEAKSPCFKFMRLGKIIPKTHNMVSTTHIKSISGKLDLSTIAESIPNSSYDRKRFAAITIRINNPKTTGLLFSSGKLVITGAVSKQMAVNSIRSVMYMLKNVFTCEHMHYENHTIQNIVCNVRLPHLGAIDVKQIHLDYSAFCTYQPSIFPGLIFRPENSPIVLLVFRSSRIVVTGARTYKDIIDGFNSILPTLQKYFVHNDPGTSRHIQRTPPLLLPPAPADAGAAVSAA